MMNEPWSDPGLTDADWQAALLAHFAAARSLDETEGSADPLTFALHGDFAPEIRSFATEASGRSCLLLVSWVLGLVWAPVSSPAGADGGPLDWQTPSPHPGRLGPRVTVLREGAPAAFHLQRAATAGIFLLRPLVTGLGRYPNPDAVFAAWSGVEQYRNVQRQKHGGRCPLQRHLSRRGMFTGLFGHSIGRNP
ncbi:MAG: hypothetical protein HQL82_04665 [Magnetococcales bacterium]|nr:hypothetical protein [Magnetococcales bacterium]